jgi:hypothetical protein
LTVTVRNPALETARGFFGWYSAGFADRVLRSLARRGKTGVAGALVPPLTVQFLRVRFAVEQWLCFAKRKKRTSCVRVRPGVETHGNGTAGMGNAKCLYA